MKRKASMPGSAGSDSVMKTSAFFPGMPDIQASTVFITSVVCCTSCRARIAYWRATPMARGALSIDRSSSRSSATSLRRRPPRATSRSISPSAASMSSRSLVNGMKREVVDEEDDLSRLRSGFGGRTCGPTGRRDRAALLDLREVRDLLRHAVVEDLEIVRQEPADVTAILVDDRHVDARDDDVHGLGMFGKGDLGEEGSGEDPVHGRCSILKRFTPARISSPACTFVLLAGSVLRKVPLRDPRSRTRMTPSVSGITSKCLRERNSSGTRTCPSRPTTRPVGGTSNSCPMSGPSTQIRRSEEHT